MIRIKAIIGWGLTLKGKNGPASAIGAKVTVTTGGKKMVFVNQWATSYLSNNDQRMHIGLGKVNKIDLLEINWSNGEVKNHTEISTPTVI